MKTIFITTIIIIIMGIFGKQMEAQDVFIEENYLNIGDIEQRVIITARDTTKPVLLFLHGHGMPSSLFAHHFYEDKESRMCGEFVVVHWDQRGAGCSYTKELDPETMNINQFVDDAHEVVTFLKDRFNEQKIYIIADSWGSIIGLKLINKYPSDFHAYIGEGQTINYSKSVLNMFNYAKEQAKIKENKKAQKQLNKLDFPTQDTPIKEFLKFNETVSKWAEFYILQEYGGKNLMGVFKSSLKTSPFYTKLNQKMSLLKGMEYTQECTLHELLATNLQDEILEINVPVAFFMGNYDFITPSTTEFYNELNANDKRLVLFEKSGHVPSIDEAELFEKEMFDFFGIK
jgi:pimeloyl-ACP methyl ester carboxylesterase